MTSITASRTASGRRRTRALGVVSAVLAAPLVWVVAVVGTNLLACVVGWVLLAVLERFTRRAALVWTVIAVVVVLVSMTGPLTAGAGAAGTLVLVVLDVAPAAVLVPVMRRTSPTA